jgi:hypothetical protein
VALVVVLAGCASPSIGGHARAERYDICADEFREHVPGNVTGCPGTRPTRRATEPASGSVAADDATAKPSATGQAVPYELCADEYAEHLPVNSLCPGRNAGASPQAVWDASKATGYDMCKDELAKQVMDTTGCPSEKPGKLQELLFGRQPAESASEP